MVGCIRSGEGRVPAVGTVTLDGSPLARVFVTLRPDDGEPGNGGLPRKRFLFSDRHAHPVGSFPPISPTLKKRMSFRDIPTASSNGG
jgi:hypothetical protein